MKKSSKEGLSFCLKFIILLVTLPALIFLFTEPVMAQRKEMSIVFPLVAPRLSSKFGPRIHPIRKFSSKHQGVDLAAPEGSMVRAVKEGVVVFSGRYHGYGKLVTIKHDDGYTSHYGHLYDFRVNTGQEVKAGEIIGSVGSTGMSTGPHLHFEWRRYGMAFDPLKVFPTLVDEPLG